MPTEWLQELYTQFSIAGGCPRDKGAAVQQHKSVQLYQHPSTFTRIVDLLWHIYPMVLFGCCPMLAQERQ